MIQLPSQVVVPIVQLAVTTLQLFLMLFTWLNPRRTRPFIGQYRAEATMASQHTLGLSPPDVPSFTSQPIPSARRPGISHPYTLPSSSASSIRESQTEHQIFPTDDGHRVEHHAAHRVAPVPT
ncbi:hypothetical protein F5Y09DRAFT_301563 [Xylaria sp. FL1042]|nr:hypothetical protein F5Y09DRAFT_301563 [Xylaria sp. FL1042]